MLSGGGAKGYIQVQVLKKLEEKFGPLCGYYDLVCGSSVGAINGAMVASGKISMERLEKIYPNMIERVFKRRWFRIPMYDRKNFIDSFIAEVGMIKMNECKTKLQITSVNLCDKRNHFFKSWTKDGEQYLVSEVCKSFAAPLYFGAMPDPRNQCVWFDGGMGLANTPVIYALVESSLLWPNEPWQIDVIGTGSANENIPYEKALKYRTARQIMQFFDLGDGGLAREQSKSEQIGALEKMSKSSEGVISMRYWDITIPKKMDKLDGVEYLSEYKRYGEEMAKQPFIVI